MLNIFATTANRGRSVPGKPQGLKVLLSGCSGAGVGMAPSGRVSPASLRAPGGGLPGLSNPTDSPRPDPGLPRSHWTWRPHPCSHVPGVRPPQGAPHGGLARPLHPQQVWAPPGSFPPWWLSPEAGPPPQPQVRSLVTAWPQTVHRGQVTGGKGRARGDWGTVRRSMTKMLQRQTFA